MSVQLDDPVRTGRLIRLAVAAALVLAGVGALLLARSALGGDPAGFVTLTIDNSTTRTVDVDLIGPGGETLRLARVEPGDSREVREVIDQGRSWVFAFSESGREVARTAPMTRDQLRAQDWTVHVPAEAGSPAAPGTGG
ncbi:MAG TPA: hypothetical protein VKG45_10195 [Actinomycetes bacterium]|nr:hypothetical protein [Actinomycetes bacterium]